MDSLEEPQISGRGLPEVEYEITSEGAPRIPWRVARIRLTEGLSELYEATLELTSSERTAAPEALLGARSTVTLRRGGRVARRISGVARQVQDLGTDHHQDRSARVVLVPELWLLSQRVTSRIFQEMDAPSIVRAVLAAAGVYEGAVRAELRARYRLREYCVQYQESDLSFVRRLLEDEGITFTFEQGEGREALVLVDDLSRFPDAAALGVPERGAPIPLVSEGAALAGAESLRRLDLTCQLNPTGATLRDWDPHNPSTLRAVLTKTAPADPGPREIFEYPAAYALRDFPVDRAAGDYGARLAGIRDEEQRAGNRVAEGSGDVAGFAPGAVFSVTAHGRDDLDVRYLVTTVEHRGEVPDARHASGAGASARYDNRFTVIDARGPFRPPRVTPRPRIHGAQTATVVGPASEEIHTDGEGRVQLLFHWDRAHTGGAGCSCWVRVAQSFSGAGWGAQFIPRIGMEAVVTFLEGNPDRPLVTGCVYNGENPPPFPVPGDKTRSGVRTRSSVGGDGFNELSFEDEKGAEQVFLHAQRDLDEVVGRDHTLKAGRDERLDIGRDQVIRVEGDQAQTVGGSRREHTGLDLLARVDHRRETTIGQDDRLRVEGALLIDSQDAHVTTRRSEVSVVGGDARREVAGVATEQVKDDKTVIVLGNLTTVVGAHDARRTFVVHAEGRATVESTTLTEIASDQEIVLRCGDSRIRLTPKGLELSSSGGLTLRSGNTVVEVTPDRARIRSKGSALISAPEVNLLTDAPAGKAQVKLTDEVKITGSMVKLNPPVTDQDQDQDPTPPAPTKLAFRDGQGRPLANKRFVLRLDDGSEVAGVLDGEGRTELEVDGAGRAKITFPEVSDVKPG